MGNSGFRQVCDICSVSVANNLVHPQTANDYGYSSFGELARFIYCLFQEIRQGCLLPLVEQWEQYVLANDCNFHPVSDEEFLSVARVLAALSKIGSSYLKRDFRREARRLLEEFTNSVLFTVAAGSNSGQGLSCFCPAIVIDVDKHGPLHLLGVLLDEFLERGGSKATILRLDGLSISPLSRSNDSWSGLQRGIDPM